MKVRCIKNHLTTEEIKEKRWSVNYPSTFSITPGNIYTVLQLSYTYEPPEINVDIKDDFDIPYIMPLFLFEIVDWRLSSYWKIEKKRNALSFKAPFYKEYFHDELREGDPKAVETFSKTVELLENEFAYSLPGDENVSANRFMFEIKQLIDDIKLNKWDYQKLSDVMADLIAKIKPEENPLHTRVLDVWAVIFNQSLDTPSDKLSMEHRELIEGILSKK
jgi:hypothetical protein